MESYKYMTEHSEHDRIVQLLEERKQLQYLHGENERMDTTVKEAQERIFDKIGPVIKKLIRALK